MRKIVVFGNSGSGKSTYAITRSRQLECAHLDLDTVAWKADVDSPTRRPLRESRMEIESFVAANEEWIMEGCYADLLEFAVPHASEIVFLNPGTATCIMNARNRPWEPHKYASIEEQNANLENLIQWIREYDQRDDALSLTAHRQLFDLFPGKKREYTSNARD